MPLDTSIKKVLVIGSGPIVIGQAAEFDYAGAQACRVLKEAGVNVVLCNSNPATIMTDQAMADEIYLEPLTMDIIKRIIRKEKPDALLLEEALLVQLHGQGQSGLAAQTRQDGVGPLLDNNAFDGLGGQGLQVNFVRHGLVGHDGSGVGVAQHHVDAGLLQHPAGLGAGIVEFSGLADDDGAGADDQDFLDGSIERHQHSPPFMSSTKRSKRKDVSLGPVQASGWNCTVKAFRPG